MASTLMQISVNDSPKRIKLGVPAFASDCDMEIFEAFVGFELSVI